MVSLLIKSGAKVKTKDQYGLSALVYALKSQNPDIVKMIKDAGGNY
jgi:ankyrin repeat protein